MRDHGNEFILRAAGRFCMLTGRALAGKQLRSFPLFSPSLSYIANDDVRNQREKCAGDQIGNEISEKLVAADRTRLSRASVQQAILLTLHDLYKLPEIFHGPVPRCRSEQLSRALSIASLTQVDRLFERGERIGDLALKDRHPSLLVWIARSQLLEFRGMLADLVEGGSINFEIRNLAIDQVVALPDFDILHGGKCRLEFCQSLVCV